MTARPVRYEDFPKLDYTNRVLNEASRLHSLPFFMRRAIQPLTIGGVSIPPGTEMGFSLYALHKDPSVYPGPERFDPHRWLPDGPALPRSAFIP
ncbi:cytochrome P450 [Streptomyces caeruleatus]|uniref:Cytochrome n=1 Tax=Streptomyces caeruleatus TaxID=661399 RepID=A0A101TGJ8_9ACTN|nr:cytochrome P450 [Streptomyces caeruleatus]KUN91615.1 hypothetical protein AQJ67_41665 [Streptomyces caeruleatus]